MTELLPPEKPKIKGYTFSVYSRSSPVFLCTVLATCSYTAKEVLRGTYRDATEGYSFVYESVSEVVLQHNQVVVLDVEVKEITEDEPVNEICNTLESETEPLILKETTGEQND